MWIADGPLRLVLQVPQLRSHLRLQLIDSALRQEMIGRPGGSGWGGSSEGGGAGLVGCLAPGDRAAHGLEDGRDGGEIVLGLADGGDPLREAACRGRVGFVALARLERETDP